MGGEYIVRAYVLRHVYIRCVKPFNENKLLIVNSKPASCDVRQISHHYEDSHRTITNDAVASAFVIHAKVHKHFVELVRGKATGAE